MFNQFQWNQWRIDEITFEYTGELYITDGITFYGPFSTRKYAKEACVIAAWGDRPLSR